MFNFDQERAESLYGVDHIVYLPNKTFLVKSTQYTVLLNAYMKLNIASLWTYSYSGIGTMRVCQVLIHPYSHTKHIYKAQTGSGKGRQWLQLRLEPPHLVARSDCTSCHIIKLTIHFFTEKRSLAASLMWNGHAWLTYFALATHTVQSSAPRYWNIFCVAASNGHTHS